MSKLDPSALMAQIPVSGQYVIVQNSQPVGILMPAEGHADPLRSTLEASGYAVKAPEDVVDLAAECHTENPRPCDISVSVGYARDLAREAGIQAPELEKLLRAGYSDEAEVRTALEATRDRLTGKERDEAEEVIGYLWPGGTATTQGS